jgi:hypothetical protein
VRRLLPLIIIGVLGILYLWQKNRQPIQAEANVTPQASILISQPSPTPERQVSEHNWMKRSLDRARDVRREVQEQRKRDE